jgi:TetR/AcrR family tetracycline transcriptional repressor
MSLDRRVIVQQAFAILNELGPEALTLRRLAARLGVQAPALYWHFSSKQDLLDEMGTQVIREAAAQQADPAQGWEGWAVEYGTGLRRTLLRYREGARIFSGTYLTDASLFAAQEASLRRLTDAGFSLRAAVCGMSTLYSYTIGFVIEEQAIHPMEDEMNPQYDLAARDQRIDPETLPLAYAAGREAFLDHDTRFHAGLQMIVAGMAKSLPTPPGTAAAQV